MGWQPHITVVIPTCNRPADVERALNSLSHVEYPSWDLLIVDQSDNPRTRQAVQASETSLPNLSYLYVRAKSVSRARNVGLKAAKGEIVAFLDDDCTVQPDWLSHVPDVFARYPNAAHVYGAVRPNAGMPEWVGAGWTPTNDIKEEFEVTPHSIRARVRLPQMLGMAACLCVRRDVALRVGIFDVHQGGGARFATFEDGDYTYRTFLAGYSFVGTPAVSVEHHGLREYQTGAATRLLHNYVYGAGAFTMKAARAGDPFALLWMAKSIWRYTTCVRPLALLRRNGPTYTSHLAMFMLGMLHSYTLRVDNNGLYKARVLRS